MRKPGMFNAFAAGVILIGFAGFSVFAFDEGASKKADANPLFQDLGEWTAECKFWESPDAEPMKASGTETSRRLGESNWIISDFNMDFGGQPFAGHGTSSYDPEKNKIVGTWIDTMSPNLTKYEGSYDAKTKTQTVEFDSVNPMTNEPTREKHTVKYMDDGTRVMTAYVTEKDKKPMKSMEITYTKKK